MQFLLSGTLFSSLLLVNILNHLIGTELGTSLSVSTAASISLNYHTALFYNCWFAYLMFRKTEYLSRAGTVVLVVFVVLRPTVGWSSHI